MSEEKPPTVDAKSSTISTATYLKFPESTSLRFAPLVFGAYGIVRNLCNNKIGGNIPLSLPPNLEELTKAAKAAAQLSRMQCLEDIELFSTSPSQPCESFANSSEVVYTP